MEDSKMVDMSHLANLLVSNINVESSNCQSENNCVGEVSLREENGSLNLSNPALNLIALAAFNRAGTFVGCGTQHKDAGSAGITEQYPHAQMELLTNNLPENLDACSYCLKILPKRKMSIHVRIHTGERPFSCSFCPKTFTRSDKLKMHMRTHTGERPYRCFCGKSFIRQDKCKRHLATHPQDLVLEHQHLIIAPRHESMVGDILRQVREAQRLEAVQHSEVKSELSLKPELQTAQPSEDLQPIQSQELEMLQQEPSHQKLQQSLDQPSLPSLPVVTVSSSPTLPDQDILCEHCDCTFRSRRSYLSHVKGHTRKDVFKCPCGREFKSSKWLSNHQRREGCLILEANTNSLSDAATVDDALHASNFERIALLPNESNASLLPKEVASNENSNKVCLTLNEQTCLYPRMNVSAVISEPNSLPPLDEAVCTPDCNPEFGDDHEMNVATCKTEILGDSNANVDSIDGTEKWNLLKALAEANGDNCVPATANELKTEDVLNNPVLKLLSKLRKKKNNMNEEQDKRHQCDFCSKSFSKKHKMHIHRRLHTGEKPYCCEVCGKAFSRKDHMIKHMNIHYKYRKTTGEDGDSEMMPKTDACSPERSVERAGKENPVLSALSGVSIMQLQQSELQTKLAALSALAKAFEIQKQEGIKPEASDLTEKCFDQTIEEKKEKSISNSHKSVLNNSSLKSILTTKQLMYNQKKPKKKKYIPKTLVVSGDADSGSLNGKYKCSQCDKCYDRSHEFLAHSRTKHRVHGNSKFSCGVCGLEIWTRRRFENHVVSHSDNEDEQHSTTEDMKTKQCKEEEMETSEQLLPMSEQLQISSDTSEALFLDNELANDACNIGDFSVPEYDSCTDAEPKSPVTSIPVLLDDLNSDITSLKVCTSMEDVPNVSALSHCNSELKGNDELVSDNHCLTDDTAVCNGTVSPQSEDQPLPASILTPHSPVLRCSPKLTCDSSDDNSNDSSHDRGVDNDGACAGSQPLCVEDFLSLLTGTGGSADMPPSDSCTGAEMAATGSEANGSDSSRDADSSGDATKFLLEGSNADGMPLPTVQCPMCSKFVYECNFQRHVTVHTSVKACSICGTHFTRNSDVKRHVKLHQRERQHHCPGCGMSFAKKDKLTLHSRRCIAGRNSYQELNFASLFVSDL